MNYDSNDNSMVYYDRFTRFLNGSLRANDDDLAVAEIRKMLAVKARARGCTNEAIEAATMRELEEVAGENERRREPVHVVQ